MTSTSDTTMGRGRARVLGALTALAAATTPVARASAQVNIERVRMALRDAPAAGSIEGTFTGRVGNVEGIVAGGAAVGAARVMHHRFFGSTQADYSRLGGQTQVSKSFIHLRYGLELFPALTAEAFVQQQQDKFQRLQLRELAGVGPRVTIVESKRLRLAYGAAAMLEYERLAAGPEHGEHPSTLAARLSQYVALAWRPDPRVHGFVTVYVQPRFDDPGDTRVLFEAALATELTRRFSVKVTLVARHDSEPPAGVKATDVEVKNAFVLHF